jgi:hypothetical protein
MLPADSVRGHSGRTGGRIESLLDGIDRRAERLRDDLPEPGFVQRRNVDAGPGNHFGLVNRDIGYRKAPDYLSVAVDETRCPSLVVVGPRGYRFSVVKNLAKVLAVWNARQKLGHCRGIVEPRRRQ